VIDISGIGAFLRLDVGKGEHHATSVTPAGKKEFDKRLPSERKLREVLGKLQAKRGTVLVVVDQPASVGALPLAVAVARDWAAPWRRARSTGRQVCPLPRPASWPSARPSSPSLIRRAEHDSPQRAPASPDAAG
jgi:hypothetical protein